MRLPVLPGPSQPFDVITLGLNSLDIVAVIPSHPVAGGKTRIERLAHLPGGQSASAAVGVARLGWRAQYVGTFADPVVAPTFGSRYVFGTLQQREFSLQTRVNYVLSPKMSLQVYMQPLVSVGSYDGFKELARPRTFDFVEYGVHSGSLAYDPIRQQYQVTPGDGGQPFTFADPDFNFKSLRLNAIYRWEWRPGSALYVVWTEQRQDAANPGRFSLRRDLGGTFQAPADDVLMVKVVYWLQR